jgi:hypothetical protein
MRPARLAAAPAAFAATLAAAAAACRALPALPAWALTAVLEGLSVAAVWIAALGWGRLASRAVPLPETTRAPSSTRFALEAGAGFAVLMSLLHLLGLAGLVRGWSAGLLLASGAAAALAGRDARGLAARARDLLAHPATALAAAPAAVLLLAASFPPGILWPGEGAGYDALEYHLQVPREWHEAGEIRALPHNVYSYLPLDFEILGLALMSLRGGPHESAIAVQWLHASFALATALLLALWTQERSGSRAAAAGAASLYLALPWNLVTGSLAYNEQAAAFLGAAALVLLWEAGLTQRVNAAAGVLAGAAAGVKLTAAGFFALPAAVATILWRDREEGAAKRPPARLALALLAFAAGAAAIHAPYLARNAAWTGNPAFPFATRAMGRAHWSEAEEGRWVRGHFPQAGAKDRADALWSRALADPQFGFPWWLAALAGLGIALADRPRRALPAALATALALQVLFWLAATHLQPRFLQPLSVPLAAAAGLAAARVTSPDRFGLGKRLAWGAAGLISLGHAGWHAAMLREGVASPGLPPEEGAAVETPAESEAATLIREPDTFSRAMDGDPLRGRPTLLVADARAFYYPKGSLYADPFQVSPFTRIWNEAGGHPAKALDALRARGVRVVVVNWDEAERLRSTYGLDPEISRANFERLERAGLRRISETGGILVLYEVP